MFGVQKDNGWFIQPLWLCYLGFVFLIGNIQRPSRWVINFGIFHRIQQMFVRPFESFPSLFNIASHFARTLQGAVVLARRSTRCWDLPHIRAGRRRSFRSTMIHLTGVKNIQKYTNLAIQKNTSERNEQTKRKPKKAQNIWIISNLRKKGQIAPTRNERRESRSHK